MINCVEFLIEDLSFYDKQIYKPCYSYHQNKHRVCNDIHTGDWRWKQQIEHAFSITILLILLSSDETVMSLSHRDQTLWLV